LLLRFFCEANRGKKQIYMYDIYKYNTFQKYIENKIEERNQAKKNKDFEKADSIRKELLAKNIKLIDTREGTTYEME